MNHKIEHSVDVNVPVRTAYNQWTQFEDFPWFMKHVESVRQIDEKSLYWRVNLGGTVREFTAEIVEQIPDQRIAWHSTTGARHKGTVTFYRLSETKCRVLLQLDYEPAGLVEKVGTLVGLTAFDIEKDMARFVEFLEQRKTETGGWRGRIPSQPRGVEEQG